MNETHFEPPRQSFQEARFACAVAVISALFGE